MDRDPSAEKICAAVAAVTHASPLTTGQRAVLAALRQQPQPLSAQALHGVLGTQRPIGLATVYRVLTQFEQAGILKRSNFESGKSVYELDEGQHHDHLVCLQCGRVEEFYDPEIERRQQRIAKDRGFALQDHALALYANCTKADCPHRDA